MRYPTANPKVIENAKQILELEPIFLDTETTGTGPNDVVIEVGIVDVGGNVLYDSLINPGYPIPAESISVHGISDEMVANAPLWQEAWTGIQKVLEGHVIGIYNAEFDLRLLKQTQKHFSLDWTIDSKRAFCVMKMYAAFYGDWHTKRNSYRFHKLEDAGHMSRIPLPNLHHAADDAKLTAALFTYMANYVPPTNQ